MSNDGKTKTTSTMVSSRLLGPVKGCVAGQGLMRESLMVVGLLLEQVFGNDSSLTAVQSSKLGYDDVGHIEH